MVQADPDRELKLVFINRQRRLFTNILSQLEAANAKGIQNEEIINDFKSRQNEIVYDYAKKAYTEYKLKHIKKKSYNDDLFSAEVYD